MDIEAIIKQITEEVYRKLSEQGADAAGSRTAAAQVGGKDLIYTCMGVGSSVAQIELACRCAGQNGFGAILVPQWFVSLAAEKLKGTGVRLATAVGLPGGLTSTFAKYAEAKQAAVNGAEVLCIPINMRLCGAGDFAAARNDFADAMAPAKGTAAVYAMIEADGLSTDQLAKAAALSAACGADMVLLSSVTGGQVSKEAVLTVKGQGIAVGVYGGVSEPSIRNALKQAGASCFAVTHSA